MFCMYLSVPQGSPSGRGRLTSWDMGRGGPPAEPAPCAKDESWIETGPPDLKQLGRVLENFYGFTFQGGHRAIPGWGVLRRSSFIF